MPMPPAVLSRAIGGPAAQELIERMLAGPDRTPCTVCFRFPLLRAMRRAGAGDRYLDQPGPGHAMIALGLAACAERPAPTRSDRHAWSASPVHEFLATVYGIEPVAPGFRRVRMAPHRIPAA